MLMGMCLPRYEISQGKSAQSCFKSHKTFGLLIFFKKRVLSDVRSEISLSDITSFLLDKLSGLKKVIFRPVHPSLYALCPI